MNASLLRSIRTSLEQLGHNVNHLSDETLIKHLQIADRVIKKDGIDVNNREDFLKIIFRYVS